MQRLGFRASGCWGLRVWEGDYKKEADGLHCQVGCRFRFGAWLRSLKGRRECDFAGVAISDTSEGWLRQAYTPNIPKQ